MKAKIVTAAIICVGNKFLIAQRDDDFHKGGWEFPGGKVEEGEKDEAALIREIDEELGIAIEVGDYLGESLYDYGRGTLLLKAWYCRWLSGTLQVREHARIHWVEAERLCDYDFLPADRPLVEKVISAKS